MKRLAVVDVNLCVGCQSCLFACARRFGNAGLSRSAIHVKSAGGIEHGFIVTVCRACFNPPCSKVCPTDALKPRLGGGVTLNLHKCIGCENCPAACTINAIFWDKDINKPAICTYCGYCVDFCPYGVLKLEDRGSDGGIITA
jgi:Fe-S-cluster-containing dehydrogenase component